MLWNDFLVSFLTAGSVVGICAFFLRKAAEKYIDNLFQRNIEQLKADLGLRKAISEDLYKSKIAIFSQITEYVYRGKNCARALIHKFPEQDEGTMHDLRDVTNKLTESLYSGRLFLAEDEFKKVHDYKNRLFSFQSDLARNDHDSVLTIYGRIEGSCDEIVKFLQSSIDGARLQS